MVAGESSFIRACRNEFTGSPPVWFMRQAGRSLPEYRALRERHGILEMCRTPELIVETTLQPVRRLGVDAAILFSDIVLLLQAMGVDLDIVAGRGPVIHRPIENAEDVRRLPPVEPRSELAPVLEAIAALDEELEVPLIGFAGAPFTLASYLIEGGPSKSHALTKSFMYSKQEAWNKLLCKLAAAVASYLRAQVEAGAAAVQLFDSWVGFLSPQDFARYVEPAVRTIFESTKDLGVPRIYFGVGTGDLLASMAATGPDVMGLDWRVPLSAGRSRLGRDIAVQGNLDPAAALAPFEVLSAHALDILAAGQGRGHVFNLGHGVLPETDPDNLARLVEFVHGWRADG